MKTKNSVALLIIKTLKRHSLLSAAVLVSVAGAVIVSLLPPLVLGSLIDHLTEGQRLPLTAVCGYFILLALAGILESARESLLTVLGQKITHALRSSLSDKLNALPADELNRQEPGAVTSRFVGDVDTVEKLFTSGIISMFADACTIISILVIIFLKNTGLAVILCIVMPFIYLFTRHVQKSMLKAHIDNRAAVSRVANHVPETIRCIRMIHTLNKEAYMEENYDRYISQSYEATEKTNFYDAVYSPVILTVNAVIVAIVMLLSASGDPAVLSFFGMSVGTAVAVINYISQIFSPIESLGMEIQTIQSAVAGVHRISEFLDLPERKALAESEGDPDACPVELNGVVFGYDDKNVLDGLSFKVEKGQQVTLAGRTGAGKSTVFKLLLGLYEPRSGHVLIHGREASEIPDDEKRRLFGYVEQNFHMIPGTVRDQITLHDPLITQEMVMKAACLTGLHETIISLEQGYDTPCSPDIFSQGQWQLLSIARAAAAEPGILLLDEITANLDADTESKVLDAVSNVSAGRTVISISHRIYQHTGGRLISI